ncbi:MAG: ABC transporter ATP-binding protein [Anaerovoracaceae bacterium]
MIEIKGLYKSFDGFQALHNLDLSVQKGSIYGLIGTNGAGKTTIIKHLAGVLRQDKGEITYDNVPVWENEDVKQQIGYIPDELYFQNGFTLFAMGKYYSRIYKNWNEDRFQKMVAVFNLNGRKKLRNFSKGMKKQAAFSLVMSTMPAYLILDEPIDGLDPIVRKLVWQYIVEDVAERELSVLVSSHNLREMEGICDSIGVIAKGQMKLQRDLDELKNDMHKVQVAFGKNNPNPNPYEGLNVLQKESRNSIDLLLIKDKREKVEEIIYKSNPILFDLLPLSLEEIFIHELGGDNNEITEITKSIF